MPHRLSIPGVPATRARLLQRRAIAAPPRSTRRCAPATCWPCACATSPTTPAPSSRSSGRASARPAAAISPRCCRIPTRPWRHPGRRQDPHDSLFTSTGNRHYGGAISREQYANLVKKWAGAAAHSMRRSKPATVYCGAGLRTGSRADGRADVRSARSLIWHAPRSASVVRGRPKLFERACGYVKGVKIYRAEDGGVIKVSYEVHPPQDTQVGTLWLAYQVLRRWGDRQVHG
jgi:hypothetical protein